MKRHTKAELEQKVANFNIELSNPFLTKSEKIRIQSAITYNIRKLAKLDETPSLKSIEA